MFMSVYVDDLLLSGPEEHHDALWKQLIGAGIKIEDPEPVDRFLGRTHLIQ